MSLFITLTIPGEKYEGADENGDLVVQQAPPTYHVIEVGPDLKAHLTENHYGTHAKESRADEMRAMLNERIDKMRETYREGCCAKTAEYGPAEAGA